MSTNHLHNILSSIQTAVTTKDAAISMTTTEDDRNMTEEVKQAFPSLDLSAASLLGKVVGAIYNDQHSPKDKSPIPLSPFMNTPASMGAISSPAAVMTFLRDHGAHVPFNGKEMTPSLNALANISSIPSGTISSLNTGRMKMDGEKLESWRNALVLIGKANDIEMLASLEDHEAYLESLLEDYTTLTSSLPLSRIIEWAKTYSPLTESNIDAMVSSARKSLTPSFYVKSIVSVWREQYLSDELDELFSCDNFAALLKVYTSRVSTKRGFNKLIPAVHRGMPQFNSRVKYPMKLTATYTNRYSGYQSETGLTAEILLAYCFFLGINPIALLNWLADNEVRGKGTHKTHKGNLSFNELVGWQGVVSPWEFTRFVKFVSMLGLVSDQEKWTLCIYDASNVYRNVPVKEDIVNDLGADALSYESVLSSGFEVNTDMPQPCEVVGDVPYMKLLGGLYYINPTDSVQYQRMVVLYALGDDSIADQCDEDMSLGEINDKVVKLLNGAFRGTFHPEVQGAKEQARTYNNLNELGMTGHVVASGLFRGVTRHDEMKASSL